MKRGGKCLMSLWLVSWTCLGVLAQTTMTVRPSPAPNAFGSPNWSAYRDNALNALENSLAGIGDPATDPTAYRSVTHIYPWEIQVTSGNSWRGLVAPPAPFNSEYGNRLHFGLHIVSTTKFKLRNLVFNMSSSDFNNDLVFQGDFNGFPYNANRVGIDYVDGIKGNGNDIVYNGGQSENNLVNELIYVGVGNAWWPDASVPLTQAVLDAGTLYIRDIGPVTVSTTYQIYDDDAHITLLAQQTESVLVVSADALPVDLRGHYCAGSKGTNDGLVTVTTSSLGDYNSNGQVFERSVDTATAPEATYSPFSDSPRPPRTLEGLDLQDSFFDVFVDLGDPTRWDPLDVFQTGVGRQARNDSSNPEAWVRFEKLNPGNFRISLETDHGGGGPFYDTPIGSGQSFFDVFVQIDASGTMMHGTVTPLNGTGYGIAAPIGTLALDTGNDNVSSASFFAGFVSAEPKSTAEVTVTDFTTGAPQNWMFVFADDPYLQVGQTAVYRLGMANLAQTVYGYQAFLVESDPGSIQTFTSGSYEPWPFVNAIVTPITGALDLAAGTDFGAPPVQMHSKLADLNFSTSAAGVASLGILANNDAAPNPQTRFSDEFGAPVVPIRQPSNLIIADSTLPTLTGLTATQAHGNVLNGVQPTLQGTLTVCVTAADNGSGVECRPTISLDFPSGTDVVNAPMYSSAGNTFCYDCNVTAANGCGTATITITASDDAGNTATPATGTLDVNTSQVTLDVALASVTATMSRCLEFQFGGSGGGNPPVTVYKVVNFTGGVATGVVFNALDGLPCGAGFSCVSVKDPQHTLRKQEPLSGSYGGYTASVTLKSGDANNDNLIDILDFGVFASKFGQNVGANTTCNPPYNDPLQVAKHHPDFSGNGIVGTEDYTFIANPGQFFAVGDTPCGNYLLSDHRRPREKATVREMIAAGIPIAAEFDLDNNGVVTLQEIANWIAGERRTKR